MSDKEKVVELGGHQRMTVEEALTQALRDNLQDVVIAGFNADGTLYLGSSKISRAEANFLLDHAKLNALGLI